MTGILHLFWLAVRRLRSQLGLTLLSLLSVILSLGIVVSIPVFAQGISYLVLREELQQLENTTNRPPLTTRFYYVSNSTRVLSLVDTLDFEKVFNQIVVNQAGLPLKLRLTLSESLLLTLHPVKGDLRFGGQEDTKIKDNLNLTVVSGMKDHMDVIEGAPFGDTGRKDRLAVWPYVDISNQMGLQVGENYDMVEEVSGKRIPIYIAGIWRERDRNDFYWRGPTVGWQSALLVTEAGYATFVQTAFAEKTRFTAWYMVPDIAALTLERVDRAAAGLETIPNIVEHTLTTTRMDMSPLEPLQRYVQRRDSLTALLVGFGLPAIGLLFYFLSLLSTVTVQFQREEAAILASRGTGKRQLMGLAIVETLLLVAVGLPFGLLLGYLMAQVMGYASDFLTFVRRAEFPATLLGLDLRLVGAALLMLILARLVPTLQAANRSIVTHLRERSRPVVANGLLKLAIDIPLIITTVYAYQQLKQRGSLGIIGWEPSGNPFNDPLLLLAPSLFVFTAALLLAHLFPILMRPVDALSGRLKSFPAYMGLRRLRRQSGQYTNPLFLVMVCLSLGAFYSSMALSLDDWLHDRIYYQVGTDYRFKQDEPPEIRAGLGGAPGGPPRTGINTGAWLLPMSDYESIRGVLQATRVGEFDAEPKLQRGSAKTGRLLGIDRVDFTQVAYFRYDFTQASLGDLMNRLGMYQDGLLVSRKFFDQNKLVEGQKMTLAVHLGDKTEAIDFQILGVYDYFPTVYPADKEGFIANLSYLVLHGGDVSLPFIWLKTAPTLTGDQIDQEVQKLGVWTTFSKDASASIKQDEDRVERIGLFGVLSIGFLAGSILSGLGLLVYTYASLQGRLQQISVLRAIGLHTREVLSMEVIEYGIVILYSVFWGAIIGILASHLFVPFFQVSTDPATALPPFLPQIAWTKILVLALIFAGTLVISQGVILYSATRKDIFQILRMGQRE